MAQNTKVIQELRKQLAEAEKSLNTYETTFGYTFLKDDQLFVDFDALQKEIAQEKDIIQEAEAAFTAASGSCAESKKDLAKAESAYAEYAQKLGSWLYGNYSSALEEAFGTVYGEAKRQEEKIRGIGDEMAVLNDSMGELSFVKKIAAQFKRGGMEKSIGTERKKIDDILQNGAKTAVEKGLLSSDLAGDLYTAAHDASVQVERHRASLAEFETAKRDAEVRKKEAKEKLAELQKSSEAMRRQCDERALSDARKLVEQYLDKNGEVRGQFPEEHKGTLDEVCTKLREVAGTRRTIDILGLEDKIAECNGQIDRMNREMAENTAKIEKLSAQNAELSHSIESTTTVIENYRQEKAALEQENAGVAGKAASAGPETAAGAGDVAGATEAASEPVAPEASEAPADSAASQKSNPKRRAKKQNDNGTELGEQEQGEGA